MSSSKLRGSQASLRARFTHQAAEPQGGDESGDGFTHVAISQRLTLPCEPEGPPECPDLAFIRQRVAVFVDGDFWHGRDWEKRKEQLQSGHNAPYWLAKIAYNRDRDIRNNELLAELGWRVVRLWETDVLKDPDGAASLVASLMEPRS